MKQIEHKSCFVQTLCLSSVGEYDDVQEFEDVKPTVPFGGVSNEHAMMEEEEDRKLIPWMPLYWILNFDGVDCRDRIIVMVCLPSGVDNKTVVCVGNGGRTLDVEISWPKFHASAEDVMEA